MSVESVVAIMVLMLIEIIQSRRERGYVQRGVKDDDDDDTLKERRRDEDKDKEEEEEEEEREQ